MARTLAWGRRGDGAPGERGEHSPALIRVVYEATLGAFAAVAPGGEVLAVLHPHDGDDGRDEDLGISGRYGTRQVVGHGRGTYYRNGGRRGPSHGVGGRHGTSHRVVGRRGTSHRDVGGGGTLHRVAGACSALAGSGDGLLARVEVPDDPKAVGREVAVLAAWGTGRLLVHVVVHGDAGLSEGIGVSFVSALWLRLLPCFVVRDAFVGGGLAEGAEVWCRDGRWVREGL